MRPSVGLASLAGGIALAATAYGTVLLPGPAPEWPAWAVGAAICLLLFGFLDLGAGRRDGRPLAVRLVFAGTAVWVGLGFLGILWSTPSDLDTPFLWGLPLPAAWMIYVLGLGPALFLPLAWAVLFRSATLPPDALPRLHDEMRRVEARRRAEAGGDVERRGGGG